MKKLVLTVIDAMKPAMLERAVAGRRAPTLKLLLERGSSRRLRAPPSVTPVRRLDRHRTAPDARIPAMTVPRGETASRVRHRFGPRGVWIKPVAPRDTIYT